MRLVLKFVARCCPLGHPDYRTEVRAGERLRKEVYGRGALLPSRLSPVWTLPASRLLDRRPVRNRVLVSPAGCPIHIPEGFRKCFPIPRSVLPGSPSIVAVPLTAAGSHPH